MILQIEDWLNILNIYDGPKEQSMKIGEVYGISNNKLLKSISSTGKTLFLDFKKEQESKTEFEASIKYNKFMSVCETWLDVNKTILNSPNNSNNINCSWLITSKIRSYIILHFKFIEVNSKNLVIFFDFIE